jgi:hypothetical protein
MWDKIGEQSMRIVTRMFFIATVIVVCVLVAHDVHVYINGGRPWSATIDGVCGIFFTPKRNCVVLKVPVQNGRMKMKVSHRWRGNYQFRLWVPNTENGKPPSVERIGLTWRFIDEEGRMVFNQMSPPSEYSPWDNQLVGVPYGYAKSFLMYTAPCDVPLDESLDADVQISGEFDKFKKSYPKSFLLLIKERDK